MALGNQMSDESVLRNVRLKLAQRATGANRVTSAVRHGLVTLTGIIWHERARRSLLATARSVPGVRRALDQLEVER